jgi:Family of unknown function (DUF6194)
MTAINLENWILDNYQGVIVTNAYRERSFFYNPDGSLPKGIYFATIKESDGPNDKSSKLDKDGAFRLSIGIGKKNYQNLFGTIPSRPLKGGIINYDFDFSISDILMPHPIYAWISWVAINNPTTQSLETIKYLLDISYQSVISKFTKKK